MPQFDVLLFAKIMNLIMATAVVALFLVTFVSVLASSLKQLASLAFNIEILNRFRDVRVFVAQSFFLASDKSDLLEQFIFAPKFYMLSLFLCLVLLLVLVLVFAPAAASSMRVFVGDLVHSINADSRADSARITIFYLTLFITILFSNLAGLIPGAFTLSGAAVAPFAFVIPVAFHWLYVLYSNNKMGAFSGLMPSGVNSLIVPLIIIIETISSIAKFASLGVRLFANMFAGHLLLKVLYSACFMLVSNAGLFMLLSDIAVTAFTLFIFSLEVLIAFLQAFVFVLLTMIYFKEARLFVSAAH